MAVAELWGKRISGVKVDSFKWVKGVWWSVWWEENNEPKEIIFREFRNAMEYATALRGGLVSDDYLKLMEIDSIRML